MTAVERDKLLKRIAVDPEVIVGKPVIRGTRLTVQLVLGLLASGQTIEEVLSEYERLAHRGVILLRLADERAAAKIQVPHQHGDLGVEQPSEKK
jgi:uncharacterized protein (DUF433 family)